MHLIPTLLKLLPLLLLAEGSRPRPKLKERKWLSEGGAGPLGSKYVNLFSDFEEEADEAPHSEGEGHIPMPRNPFIPSSLLDGSGGIGRPESATSGFGIQTKQPDQSLITHSPTSFQAGRLANLFFGFMLMIIMIMAPPLLWIAGLSYLPGKRSLGKRWRLKVDADQLLSVTEYVLDAIELWEQAQLVYN